MDEGEVFGKPQIPSQVKVYGSRVRQARMLRQVPGTSVLAALGWKGARLSRLEKLSASELDVEELACLVGALNFPASFFTTAPPPRRRLPELLFEAPRRAPATAVEYLGQFASAVGEFVEQVDSGRVFPAPKVTAVCPGNPLPVLAAQVRAQLGLAPDSPIRNMIDAAEAAGVVVVCHGHIDAGTATRRSNTAKVLLHRVGWSAWVGDRQRRPLIVLRSGASWDLVRHAVAVELGQLLLDDCLPASRARDELAARLASELLAPSAVLEHELCREPTLRELVAVKRRWGLSLATLIAHLHSSGLISDDRREKLRTQLHTRINPDTGRTWGRTEPEQAARPIERPELLARCVSHAWGPRSASELSQRSGLWPPDIIGAFLSGQGPSVQLRGGASPGLNERAPVDYGQRCAIV